jgi:hypothetical protein
MKVHFKGNLGGLAGGGGGVTDEDELAAARVSGPWVRLS